MVVGKVKWFNNEKGYGFIHTEELPEVDVFVHYSAILCSGFRTLSEGDTVHFDLIETPKGFAATEVSKAE